MIYQGRGRGGEDEQKQEDGTLVQMNVEEQEECGGKIRARQEGTTRIEGRSMNRLTFFFPSNFKYAPNEQLIIHSLLINVEIIFSFIFVRKITKRGHQDYPQLSIIMNVN